MNLLRTVKSDMCRVLYSWRFYVALVLPFIFYIASGIGEISALWNSQTDVLYFSTFLLGVGSFSTMLVLAACFPFAHAYCEDVKNRYIRLMLPRCRLNNYCASKVTIGALSGGIAAAAGYCLFLVVLSARFPLVIEDSGMVRSFIMASDLNYGGELLEAGRHIMFFMTMVCSGFLFGAFWGAVGITVSGFIPNPFVAMFTPFLLDRLSVLLVSRGVLSGLRLHPTSILNGTFNFAGPLVSMLYATAYICVLTGLCLLIFRIYIGRRLRRD